eukprot:COSAG01_NODE_4994_length_4559_cov_6.934529_8_plen_60_part_00
MYNSYIKVIMIYDTVEFTNGVIWHIIICIIYMGKIDYQCVDAGAQPPMSHGAQDLPCAA